MHIDSVLTDVAGAFMGSRLVKHIRVFGEFDMTSPLAFFRVFLSSTRIVKVSALLAMGIVGLLATVVGRSPVAAAADLVWVGNDAFNNSDFASSGNWQGNTLPSWGFTNSLKFNQNQNSNVTGLTYNWGDWRAVNDIFWDTTFPVARTLSASTAGGIDFKTRIENNSSFTQTVAMNLSGGKDGASDIQLNPVKGSLTLSGTIYNDNSVDYTVYGSDTGTITNLPLNTALGPNATQANVDFTVAGGRNTAVQVNASQLWAGTTTVNSGDFTTGNGVTLASTAIVVGGGTVATTSANTLADTASLTVNTGRLSIGGSDTIGSLAGTAGTVAIGANTLTVSQSGTTTYAGAVTGNGTFTKTGSGILTLTGNASAYAGATQVQAGTVAVNGSLGGSVDVSLNAILRGTGTVGGNATIAGTHSPGNSPGAQTFNGNLTYQAGAVVNWELIANTTGTPGTNYDQIIVPTGNLTFSGSTTLALSFDSAGSSVDWADPFWNVNRSWMVYDLSGGTTNSLSDLGLGGSLLDSLNQPLSPTGRGYFTTSLSGQDVMLNFVAVPEPSTLVLLGIAAAFLAVRRRAAR